MTPGASTLAVHGPPSDEPGVSTPVHHSVTYDLDAAAYRDLAETGGRRTWWYTRLGNPSLDACARRIAALEGAEAALPFASGMAAISTALLALSRPAAGWSPPPSSTGTHAACWPPTSRPAGGGSTPWASTTWRAGGPRWPRRRTRSTWRRSRTRCCASRTLPALAGLAHGAGALALVDATFTSPVNVRPLEHGFDVVLQSATKFLNGHSDLVAGVAAGAAAVLEPVYELAVRLGGCLDPGAAFLLERGLKTLPLRMERHNANALAVADWLAERPAVEAVAHPFRADHPDAALARRLLAGGSGLVSFRVAGGDARARRLLDALRVFRQAASLGGVESLACLPALTSHLGQPPEALARQGSTPARCACRWGSRTSTTCWPISPLGSGPERARLRLRRPLLLDANAKVDEWAPCAGVHAGLLALLRRHGWTIRQLPCPELAFAGPNRFWAVREQYDTPGYRRYCRRLAAPVAAAVEADARTGAEVLVLGVDGSPSMGVRLTSTGPDWGGRPDKSGDWDSGIAPGAGVFVEVLLEALAERGVTGVRAHGLGLDLPDYDEPAELARLEGELRR